MQLIRKSMQKIKCFNVKWTLKDKKLQQSCHFFKKLIKNIYLESFNAHH